MYGAEHAHDQWWYGPLHLVFLVVLLALLVLAVVWLVRRLSPRALNAGAVEVGATAATATDPAVAELRLRYARGEIEREGYLQSFADLTGRAEAWPGQATAEAPTATPPPAAT